MGMEKQSIFWTIDRIEGEIAVVEIAVGKTVDIPLSALPDAVREGSVLRIDIDGEEEARRRKKTRSLFNRLRVD